MSAEADPCPPDAPGASRFIPAAKAAYYLEMALRRSDPKDVQRLALIWEYYLTSAQRALIALAGLESVDSETALRIAEAELEYQRPAGAPVAPFTTVAAEADGWAESASEAERKGYFVAIWARLSLAERRAFLDWAGTDVSRGGLMAQFRRLTRVERAKFLAAAQKETVKA